MARPKSPEPVKPPEWWEQEPNPDCVNWVEQWLEGIGKAICGCLTDCGIPVPTLDPDEGLVDPETGEPVPPTPNKCIGFCPPDPTADGLLAAAGCCNRIDVWPETTQAPLVKGQCDPAVPLLVVGFRLLRCRVDWEACSPEDAAAIKSAQIRDLSVLSQCMPQKICGAQCCGGLVTQSFQIQPVCSPCEGVQGRITVSQQYFPQPAPEPPVAPVSP